MNEIVEAEIVEVEILEFYDARKEFEAFIRDHAEVAGWHLVVWCEHAPEHVRHANRSWSCEGARRSAAPQAIFAWHRHDLESPHWVAIPIGWIADDPWLLDDATEVIHVSTRLPEVVAAEVQGRFGRPRIAAHVVSQ